MTSDASPSDEIDELVERLATTAAIERFSGAIRVDAGGGIRELAFGDADRAHAIANTPAIRFASASAAKGMTAVAVLSLVADGTLSLGTPAREWLGGDLALIGDTVTVEHLLAHRSGIGDYLDESAYEMTDHIMPVPVHVLAEAEDYLTILDGYPDAFAPGARFEYNNGGFVVLAIIAERASGIGYHQLVDERVLRPAGMTRSGFLRSDELPGDVALGYLEADGLRHNVLHLPVRGVGDGGLHTTVADVRAFWVALCADRLLPHELTEAALVPLPTGGKRAYGLGFWMHASGNPLMLEGYDAGVSFRSMHDRVRDVTVTVIANWTDGAWPLAQIADGFFHPSDPPETNG